MQTHFQECELGFTYQTNKLIVFFGKTAGTLSNIEKKFSAVNFSKIKQIHSDIVVQASSQIVEADAHYTTEKNLALLIATADCTPILILNKNTNTIAAIHAGWRGVVNQITVKTIKKLLQKNSTKENFEIWIGPHILENSFEVQSDVLDLLLSSSYSENKSAHYQKTKETFFVNLNQIVLSQIHSQIAQAKIHSVLFDTKTDLRFNSYRRDKDKSGRNLSFICLLN